MFTGIVEELAKIKDIKVSKDFCSLEIISSLSAKMKIGDSILINGVCLTVVSVNKKYFSVDVVRETLTRSTLGDLNINYFVNLERAMKLSSRIDGHIVQGHIESTGLIIDKCILDNQADFKIQINDDSLKYCIKKGSITIDGISLTIADIEKNEILITIIPHTLKNTNLRYKEIGDNVNLETDMFAKYIENILMRNKYE
tara:strand:+ start:3887 stop:4483 length:597 start_codon:yes stop_codon:yes gene_type:complete